MAEPREHLTRRGRLALHGIPIILAALIAFIVGAVKGGGYAPARDSAERFTKAWEHGEFNAMYSELGKDSKKQYSPKQFTRAYQEAAQLSTQTRLSAGGVDGPGTLNGKRVVSVPLSVRTRAFGTINARMLIPLEGDHIAWAPNLVFPGLDENQHLERRPQLPPRANILANNGATLASGTASNRTSTIGPAAAEVTGRIGAPDATEAAAMFRVGFPKDALGGTSGLEKAFNTRLAGQPGGDLIAASDSKNGGGERLLGHGEPKTAPPLKTTITPLLQVATYNAMAGAGGGAAVLDAKNGAVRALAGSAFSAPQPPGSTFKIVTTVAALEANAVKLTDQFPITDGINVGGRFLENNNGETCGGSFIQAFEISCNSVFAPLGPKIGNDRMVSTAQRFGFNAKPQLYNAAATAAADPPESTIPAQIGSDLDLGVTAIGQGKLLATPLEMASVAQTIAAGGMRSPTPIVTDPSLQPAGKPQRVTSEKTAGTLRQLMIDVVANGTGILGGLPGVTVAGKTGTAELGPKPGQSQAPLPNGEKPKLEQIKDAWFTAFAPAKNPKLVVCVLVTNAEADGGQVAAPVARQILAAALLRNAG